MDEDQFEAMVKGLTTNKVTLTAMINEIYRKERVYVPSYDKDNFIASQANIFELQRTHNLKSQSGVEDPT